MKKRIVFLSFILLAVFYIWISFADTPFVTSADPMDVEALNEEETKILSELFIYKQQIETSEIKIDENTLRIQEIEGNISQMAVAIQALEAEKDLQLDRVGAFLKYYQKKGPNSYFEMFFTAETIGDFIWNINVLKDFSKNMEEAVLQLQTMQANIQDEQSQLEREEVDLKTQQTHLRQLISENEIYVAELDSRLNALNEEKDRYASLLDTVDAKWRSAQDQIAFLSETVETLMAKGSISSDLYTLKFTLTGLEVTFTDQAITTIFNQRWDANKVELSLSEDDAIMSFVDHDMVIHGRFEIIEGYLTYVATSATYDGLPIDSQALETVFDREPIEMKTETLFENAEVKSFEQRDGLLWFKISTGLF